MSCISLYVKLITESKLRRKGLDSQMNLWLTTTHMFFKRSLLWYSHILVMDYMKYNSLLILKIWLNLKCIMLSKRSQTQKTTHCLSPIYINSRKGKIIVVRAWGWGKELFTKGQDCSIFWSWLITLHGLLKLLELYTK